MYQGVRRVLFDGMRTLLAAVIAALTLLAAPAAVDAASGARCKEVSKSISLIYIQPYPDRAPVYVWVQTTVTRCGNQIEARTVHLP